MTIDRFTESGMVFLYVTVPDADCARRLATAAITEKLAACANILPQMQAIYEWDGKIEQSDELVMILKTSQELAPTLAQKVADDHPYEVPCILEIPLGRGHDAYIAWLGEQTRHS
ncbi:divalent-cation tolerance protein CutA [Thalassospira sp.]|uniref:divalent-cation tolerance protein CutA n=1 Tax=Thalassospira sp. TaxID=1912094 RepID=UPI0027339D49|nr:divalent-cation tolerance protein CutA [Thalassospira sp.]MDP2697881.1 divalent-cation tolerance protein CutA [Thalassospira sp.]